MSATESPAEILARLQAEREIPTRIPPPVVVAIGTTGSRNLVRPSEVQFLAFWALFDRLGGTELHHGDCDGWDRAIDRDARRRRSGLLVVGHPADWYPTGWDRRKGPYRPAGPIRNREIAEICRAAIAAPGNVGTADCVRAFHSLSKKVLFIQDEVEGILAAERDSIERDHVDLGLWSCMETHTGT